MSDGQPSSAAAAQHSTAARRYYVVTPNLAPLGYDTLEVAVSVARQYGDGSEIVDTLATPYHPMVQKIEKGEPVYLEYGAWPTKGSLELNLIEAVKKGHPAIVRAYLAKGADVNARDARGGTALMWAVARRVTENVRLLLAAGAEVNARDHEGLSALKLARTKNLAEIARLLEQAGGSE